MTKNNQNGNPGLSTKQKEQLKKYAVFALMGIIFVGSLYLIFAPSADDKAKKEQSIGFNADIPMPKNDNIIEDKREAYEQEIMKQRQEERMRTLQDFSAMFGDKDAKQDDGLALMTEEPATRQRTGGGYTSQNRKQTSIQSSAQTYRDMNRTLGSFYETPREDPEKERMRVELEELQARLNETENSKNPMDAQLELMEKSFQMAAKYMPGMTATGETGKMGETVERHRETPQFLPKQIPVRQRKRLSYL